MPCQDFDVEWKCRISEEIAIVAFDAFTFVIVPVLIVGHLTHGSKFEFNVIVSIARIKAVILFSGHALLCYN